MGTLFLIGTFWFYALILVAAAALIISTELDEAKSWGFWVVAATLVVLYFCGNKQTFNDMFSWISANPGTTILIVAGYFVAGLVWAIMKWYVYLRKKTAKINAINAYGKTYGLDQVYSAAENKERILNWMMYWPVSLLWTLIDEPVKKMFLGIYNNTEKMFQRMADNARKNVKSEQK